LEVKERIAKLKIFDNFAQNGQDIQMLFIGSGSIAQKETAERNLIGKIFKDIRTTE